MRPGTSVYGSGLYRRHLEKLHRSVPAYLPLPSLQGNSPDTHMGSRVLLSQDFSASKFSMIILETIHRGPRARHTPQPAQVAAATAAAAPSSARHPRGPRWEAPVAGTRESRSLNSSVGTAAGRESTGCQELPPPRTPARAKGSNGLSGPSPFPSPQRIFLDWQRDTRLDPNFLSVSGSDACWQRRTGQNKDSEGERQLNGKDSGGLPGSQHPQEDGCR